MYDLGRTAVGDITSVSTAIRLPGSKISVAVQKRRNCFRKNDSPHNLKVALCIVSGKVKHAYSTCVAGAVGFCNHVLAFMMKVCKFTLYE